MRDAEQELSDTLAIRPLDLREACHHARIDIDGPMPEALLLWIAWKAKATAEVQAERFYIGRLNGVRRRGCYPDGRTTSWQELNDDIFAAEGRVQDGLAVISVARDVIAVLRRRVLR